MKTIQNQLVLITGGASGIGRLMVLGFAQEGARVVAWDINADALKALEDEGRRKGVFIRGEVCDVADRDAVYQKAAALVSELGPVDILINNAGIVSGTTFLQTPDEKICKTLDVNVTPLFWTCKAFLPSMIERNSGHVVTISSAAGIIGVTGLADYSASKFAAFGFHEAIRMELRRIKSRVDTTVVCPFFINTGMFSGVKTRFSCLLPILDSRFVARRIIGAVLRRKKRLLLPGFVYCVYLVRLLPVAVFDAVADFFGINRSMDDFTGRKARGGKETQNG
ncbi:SDR family oxidoreductase [Desulfosarcina sp. OttesenSCG-928-A07]|nr:SDR family oxidoreductase [Desulfosarcina sp. OttesenSCG-928-G17]MDL2330041.1 SDR family oxidoreductase [Desulfosarcina sp. OttesenSCG-928-A07]